MVLTEAGEEIFIQAQEDQTVGVTLREEPALRLDQAPEKRHYWS